MHYIIILFTIIFVTNSLKIGIIGGGASGLFLSRTLRENGYNDITIFEKEDRVSPIVQTLRIDTNNNDIIDNYDVGIDLTTNFIPSKSYVPGDRNEFTFIYGKIHDILLEIEEMFDANITLTPEIIEGYDFIQHKKSVPDLYRRFLPQDIASAFIDGIVILRKVLEESTSISDLYNKMDLCQKGETIYEWGQRTNNQIFAMQLISLSNPIAAEVTGMNKSGANHPCSYIFRRSAMMDIDVLRRFLIGIDVDADSPLLDKYKNTKYYDFIIKVLNNDPAYDYTAYNFHHGYAQIFEYIAEIERLNHVNIGLNSEVIDITRNTYNKLLTVTAKQKYATKFGKIKYKTSKYKFDAVFITVRPIDAIKFIREELFFDAYKLYDEAKFEAGSFTTVAWESNEWIDNELLGDVIIVNGIFSSLDRVSQPFYEDILNEYCFPWGYYHDFPNLNYFASNSFTDRYLDEQNNLKFIDIDECVNYQQQHLHHSFGFTNLELKMQTVENYYPYIIPVELEKNGWHEQLDAIQGENGMFYFGEVVSGQTSFGILRYIQQNVPNKIVPKLLQIELNKIENECNKFCYYMFENY